MFTNKFYRRKLYGVGLIVMIFFAVSPVDSRQIESAFYADGQIAHATGESKISSTPAPAASPGKNSSPDKSGFLSASTPTAKIVHNKITSFFVRANDSKRIQLSILVAHKQELTKAVRELFDEKVTPLLFSVSTLPNRTVSFDPALLRFEQRGRVWQPNQSKYALDILPVEEGAQFGGPLTDSQVHQGVILLPAWFDPQAPITICYSDFRYLAQFAQE
jgi:hypothetical protein